MDGEHIMHVTHGWRTVDAIKKFAPKYATVEYADECERNIPEKYGEFSVQVPGLLSYVKI